MRWRMFRVISARPYAEALQALFKDNATLLHSHYAAKLVETLYGVFLDQPYTVGPAETAAQNALQDICQPSLFQLNAARLMF